LGSEKNGTSKRKENGLAINFELTVIVCPRADIEAGNTSEVNHVLRGLLASPDTARGYKECVEITFDGYDEDPEELFEKVSVREFVKKLDEEFPFWLYFLSKQHLGLQTLLLCFLPPHLTDEARKRIFPNKLSELLSNRWFPALNHVAEYASLRGDEIDAITQRTVEYVYHGPFGIKGLA